MRIFYTIYFTILIHSVFSQVDKGLQAKITFNNNTSINEISGKPVKEVNTLHVRDRFGNDGNASFMHGAEGSYINLGRGSELKPENGSISLWVKMEIVIYSGKGYQFNPIMVTKNGILDAKGTNDDFCESYVISYDYKVHRLVGSSSIKEEDQVIAHSKDTLALYTWHHVVLTYDSASLTFYVDGVVNARMPKNFKTIFSATDSVLIGHTGSTKNMRYFCGVVDDILIYNRVLNAKEVRELYNAPDPNKMNYYLKWLKWIFGCGLLLYFIIWLFLRKLKKDLEAQKEKNRINARMNELETRAIRTQMNPHFMFNALNTLQRFILEEDTANANSYLIKFSKLLRQLLESSSSESISLKEEIGILTNYVEIEKLRFDKPLDCHIICDIGNPDSVQVPFMLIQPFVENAIWHGLQPKTDSRKLEIVFSNIDENTLLCRVEDNGVGRKYSFQQKDPFRKKSMAMEFTRQRMAILEKVSGVHCGFKITDKEDLLGTSEGTIVEIVLPKIKK